jgi:hypothetical protein
MGTIAHSPLDPRDTAPRPMPGVPTPFQASARRRVLAHTAMVRRNLVGPLLITGEEGDPLSGTRVGVTPSRTRKARPLRGCPVQRKDFANVPEHAACGVPSAGGSHAQEFLDRAKISG